MLLALSILLDDEFEFPIYADPSPEEIDPELWGGVCELIQEMLDGDREKVGSDILWGIPVVWRHLPRQGLTFVAAGSASLKDAAIGGYLKDLAERYQDEVVNLRNPERDGLADVVIDVIPPWEDDEDWAE